jgi:flagellar motor protein MotB
MEEQGSADHLNSSLTDLMTSLMVIFILLLLVFVQRTAGRDPRVIDALLKDLQQDMQPQGFSEDQIRRDPRDKNAILVIVPNRLMNFEISKSDVSQEGKEFLRRFTPHLAGVVCSDRYQSSVESIIVEGHTDKHQWTGETREQSQNHNLVLSQQRSMEVVKVALNELVGDENERGCFLEKLSATGRGEQEPEKTDDDSRRVIFKIRVRVVDEKAVEVGVR